MRLTVLSVAYPLARVGDGMVGGSEQILTLLDEALTEAGHRSIVIACTGSTVKGTLLATPPLDASLDDEARQRAQEQHRAAIASALEKEQVDLVHMHGVDFLHYLPPAGTPVLVTLHLPPEWYPPETFRLDRPKTYLHCVSATQRRACPAGAQLLPEIPNGVPVEQLTKPVRKRDFACALGRICPEKGYHLAIEACRRAGVQLLLAGEVFRYPAHERYFEEEIRPRLDAARRFIGPLKFSQKQRILTAARCLLVPSLVAETSSLVAMEALACGTPVIAFPSGALTEIIEHGRTGFLVRDEEEMAEAIAAAPSIDPEECRRVARERFTASRMAARYLSLYQRIARGQVETGE